MQKAESRAREPLSARGGVFHFGKSWYTPRLFSYEWQIKELGKGESV